MLPLFVSATRCRQDSAAISIPGQVDAHRQAIAHRLAQGPGAIGLDGQPHSVVEGLKP